MEDFTEVEAEMSPEECQNHLNLAFKENDTETALEYL
jgi:hypothetical protein